MEKRRDERSSGFLPKSDRPVNPFLAVIRAIQLIVSIHIFNLCTSNPFSDLSNHCASSQPINASQFHNRQRELANTLHALNASAYITEPGANALYYGNVSTASWRLSERPLLLIVTPVVINDEVEAKITVLAPYFEATRARMLPIPYEGVEYIEWPEDANPYEMAASILPVEGNVFLDDAARLFIFNGFQKALPHANVSPAPPEIKQIRQRKSIDEIELLKCANEATLLAIRAVHKNMSIAGMMTLALKTAGLQNGGCLTLFGENAALPHGSGTDRILGESDFALFDCGGSLHGYVSDVTRLFRETKIPSEHEQIWEAVLSAQTVASRVAAAGVIARDVDASARFVFDLGGYGPYFTHRLGHGIGLEGHEEPYLRGGSLDVIKTGHTFSNEPGVYIEGKVGVRLEDCFYIDYANGQSIFLTEGVGGQASSPWNP
ncbi:Creatinase/aminopeptidase [Gymnopus androsaceus JB14]|uniref:Creatinase/aminopeptidase n=1 Tax=Gymnopus androsaceus JB14 TaxID=1447944 RepID=A0A6A4IBU7_9AGAR|nr:Creatinase/aminopeptidase [Gymnopus androsaceus JB14]